jgi:hypothetical protein
MIKKKFLYGCVAALAAAIVIFAGCSQATDSDNSSVPAVTPDGLVVDRTVNGETALVTALADSEVDVVAYVFGDESIDATVIIPAGKTVYLLNPDTTNVKTLTPSAGLEVRGTLIVSESTRLAATNTGKVYLGNSGLLQIQAGGELITDKLKSVSDLTDAGVAVDTVLGKSRIRYAGGSALTITEEAGLAVEAIKGLLSDITPAATGSARSIHNADNPIGESAFALVLPLTNVKPSQIEELSGIVDAGRTITATPAATEDPELSKLIIPEGANITITQDLLKVDTLTVGGNLTVTSGKAIGGGDASASVVVTIAGGGALTIDTIKVKAGSSIAGAINGTPALDSGVDSTAIFKPGAKIDGVTVADDAGKIVILSGDIATVTVGDGETNQFTKGTYTLTSLTVPLGGTLIIPSAATVTLGNGSAPTAFNVAGTIKVAGTLTVDVGTTAIGNFFGTIEVEKTGATYDKKPDGGSLWGGADATLSNGSYVYKAGATAHTWRSSAYVEVIGGDDAEIKVTDGTFTLQKTLYTLAGGATLLRNHEVGATITLTVSKGSVLTIGSAGNFAVAGTVTVLGEILGSTGDSTITLTGTINGAGATNFYATGNVTGPETAITGSKTYQWSADANGTTAGAPKGWKAQ